MTYIVLLALLQIKHFFADFAFQTEGHFKYKGVYGHVVGMQHSLLHAVLTSLVFLVLSFPIMVIIVAGLIDFVLHYHIDYVKMKYGTKNSNSKRYWVEFGLDQLAHQFTYILLIILTIGT